MDTSLTRTLLAVPRVSAIKRFHCTVSVIKEKVINKSLDNHEIRYVSQFFFFFGGWGGGGGGGPPPKRGRGKVYSML